MRKIDPKRFKIAKRHTSREINRQIALTLIRTHQPVSRADLARLMGTRRGVVSILVNELLAESLIFEGATGEGGGRGRKPTFLYIDSRERYVIAVDIRATRDQAHIGDLAFVSVSDGIGVGIVVNGEVLRGQHNIAGEFGHVPLSIDGPRCSCGATGCWEAYVSNLATLSRYFGRGPNEQKPMPRTLATFSVEDLIARARGGDRKAVDALRSTARYLGLGLGGLIN